MSANAVIFAPETDDFNMEDLRLTPLAPGGVPRHLQLLIVGLSLRQPAPSAAHIHCQVAELAQQQGWAVPSYATVYAVVCEISAHRGHLGIAHLALSRQRAVTVLPSGLAPGQHCGELSQRVAQADHEDQAANKDEEPASPVESGDPPGLLR